MRKHSHTHIKWALPAVAIVALVVGISLYCHIKKSEKASDELGAAFEQLAHGSKSGVTMLPIPTLGVKIPVPNSITDFQYIDKGGSVMFTRKSFEMASKACSLASAPFGYFTLTKKSDVTTDTNAWAGKTQAGIQSMLASGMAKDMGQFYLLYVTPQDASCAVALGAKTAHEPWGFELKQFVKNAEVL